MRWSCRSPPQLRAPWLGAERLAARCFGDSPGTARYRQCSIPTRRERSVAQRLLTLYGEPLQTPAFRRSGGPAAGQGCAWALQEVCRPGHGRPSETGDPDRSAQERALRARRCCSTPTRAASGGFKPPRLDNQVNVRSGGVIGQRVHLAVDYDTERDFSANNNIQVYYQGLEDEIIRRIEVGTVTFSRPNPGSSPRPSRPTTSGSTPGSRSGLFSFRPWPPLRKEARLPSGSTPSVRQPASPRTGSSVTWTSRPDASSGWSTRPQPSRTTRPSIS